MSNSRISDIMSAKVISIPENDSLAKTVITFEQNRISGAPVINESGAYVGVISKTDLVTQRCMSLVMERNGFEKVQVKDLMNPTTLVTVSSHAPIDDAIALMVDNQIHRIFVTDAMGKLVGLVSTLDIVRAMRYTVESYL